MYPTRTTDCQYVVVNGLINNQSIISTFWLRAANTNISSGESEKLLDSFIVTFRSNILSWWYDIYTVHHYDMFQAMGSLEVPIPGAPPATKWIPDFDPLAWEFRAGDPALDKGAIASSSIEFLPVHDALRVRKQVRDRRRGYFRGAYNRFCQFPEAKADLELNQWDSAWFTVIQPSLTTFNMMQLPDMTVAPNIWEHSVFSPTLHGRVIQPAGGKARDAASVVASYTARRYIGTQTTRRYRPDGLRRGA